MAAVLAYAGHDTWYGGTVASQPATQTYTHLANTASDYIGERARSSIYSLSASKLNSSIFYLQSFNIEFDHFGQRV